MVTRRGERLQSPRCRTGIGGGAIILSDVAIADGAIIGAGSTVTRDGAAGAAIAGTRPALSGGGFRPAAKADMVKT
jgi:serine acetyltransferase